MAALVQGPPYSGEWTLDTRFHCQAWQWPWKPGSTVKPQPLFLEWPWKPGSTVNPHPHSDPGNQVQLWTPTPTVTLETRFNCETLASVPHSDPGNQVPRCACGNFNWIYKFSRKSCWWTVFNLWSFMMIWLWTQCWKPSLKLCIFLPMMSLKKFLRQFSRVRLRNKNWKIICNHVSFWARSNFFLGRDLTVLVTLIAKNTITTLKILYCICALHVHQVTAKKHFPPFPAVHNDACVQVTFWQAGHKGMYDILITVYELSPGNQVSSSIYSFAILCRSCSRVIKCLCSLHLHVKTNICSDWNMLATCVLHFVGCKSFPTGHNGGRDT